MSCLWSLTMTGANSTVIATSRFVTCPPPACVFTRSAHSRCSHASSSTAGSRGRLMVMCMAHPRRVARVTSQIQREISDLFVSDPVIQSAICPERVLGHDTLSAVASITNTYVSSDLQVVKVFVSVYSDSYGKRVAMNNLQRLAPYVRHLIGQRVRLRLTPEIRFLYDDSEEEADLVARVIGREEIERYRQEIEADMVPETRRAPEGGVEEAVAAAGEQSAMGAAGAPGAEGDDGVEEEEEEEEEEDYIDPDELPQSYPTPFDFLFRGEEEEVEGAAQGGERRQGEWVGMGGEAGRGGRGEGRRGRGGGRELGRGRRGSGRGARDAAGAASI